MASSPRTEAREEERRLNMRTLVIASSASAAAAAITSQLWIRGTWIAAAVTPVLVAIVSELLERPSAKIARAVTSDRPALPASARPAPEPETREVEPPPQTTPGPGPSGPPVRVYRQPPPRRLPRKRFALGLVLATAGIAFVIGVTVFTATELLAGESIGKSSGRTSLWSSDRSDENRDPEQRDRTQPDTSERTAPPDRPETQPTTPSERPETQPTTPSERPETQSTTPEETTPAAPAPADEPETEPAP